MQNLTVFAVTICLSTGECRSFQFNVIIDLLGFGFHHFIL